MHSHDSKSSENFTTHGQFPSSKKVGSLTNSSWRQTAFGQDLKFSAWDKMRICVRQEKETVTVCIADGVGVSSAFCFEIVSNNERLPHGVI